MAIANSSKVEMTSNNRNLGELTMADDSMTFWDVLGQQGEDFLRNLMERVLEQLMDFGSQRDSGEGSTSGRKPARPTGMGIGNDRCTRGWARWSCRYRSCGKELFSVILEPRRLAERALTAVIQEAWIGGMSTRKVDGLVQALGMTGITKSSVRLCRDIDERVKSFLERPWRANGLIYGWTPPI